MKTRFHLLLALLVLVSLLLPPALASAADTDGAPWDVKFAGVITTVPAAAGDSWVIAGQTVKTDANTKLNMATEDPAAAGMWADVMARKQSDGALLALKVTIMAPELMVIGPLQAMPEGDAGTWTVAGIDFTVDADTKISDRGDPIMVDSWVEVHAIRDGDAFVATSIRSVEEQEDVEIYGAIEAFSGAEWTVSGITVTPNADTKVMGKPAVGLLARVSADLQEDGTLLARNVKVAWNEQGGWRQPRMFFGKIDALPETGMIGVWTIDGKQVDVSAQTRIMQKKAAVELGATVHVVGYTEGDLIKALMISVIKPSETSKTFQLVGAIEALPAEGMVGEWVVSGKTIVVTENTRLAGEKFVKVGARVTVLGTEKPDGTLVATLVHAKQGK